MSIFDIIGPVMVGPSSSHTAGAVRIGYICRRLIDEEIVQARINLYGSFLATGRGHGTDRALVAGLLGMRPNDIRIPESLELAEQAGMEVSFGEAVLRDVNPNTAELILTGQSGRTLSVVASSLGGGRIKICRIDGLETNFCGDYPTLIVRNLDQPGRVQEVTAMLSHHLVNIATMQLYRASRDGYAVMVLECDQEVPHYALEWLEKQEGILKVTYLSLQE